MLVRLGEGPDALHSVFFFVAYALEFLVVVFSMGVTRDAVRTFFNSFSLGRCFHHLRKCFK